MLMDDTSAKSTGMTTFQLAETLTEKHWTELEEFADNRLRWSMNNSGKRWALAIYDGSTLFQNASGNQPINFETSI